MMHCNSMLRIIRYYADTLKKVDVETEQKVGWKVKFIFQISGSTDNDCVKCPATRCSISDNNVKFEGVVIICKSDIQKTTTLSMMESETVSGFSCAQDMTYTKSIMGFIGLEVDISMGLEVDNRGSKYMVQNFIFGIMANHMEIASLWKGELQEKRTLDVRSIKGVINKMDIKTKNISDSDFNNHCKVYCSEDMYI